MLQESGGLMQKCKNCGAELKPGMKFCTKCGTPVDNINTKRNSTSFGTVSIDKKQTVEQIKKHSLNYFSWYKDSIIRPSDVKYDNKYFGLISLLLNAIIVAWAFYIVGHRTIVAAVETANQYSNLLGRSSDSINVPNGLSLYLKLLIITALYFAIFLLVGFVCKKYLINNRTNIFDYANQLASFSNSMVILEFVIAIVLLMSMPSNVSSFTSYSNWSSVKLLIVLIVLIANIWMVSYIASIVIDKGLLKIDKIYVAVITLIVNSAVLYFVYRMVYNSLISQYPALSSGIIKGVWG